MTGAKEADVKLTDGSASISVGFGKGSFEFVWHDFLNSLYSGFTRHRDQNL